MVVACEICYAWVRNSLWVRLLTNLALLTLDDDIYLLWARSCKTNRICRLFQLHSRKAALRRVICDTRRRAMGDSKLALCQESRQDFST